MNSVKFNENFNFTKTCRLCLNHTNELVSIFDISSYEIEYLVIINECTSLKISGNDKLPKNICLECVECLNKFHQFRKLVVNSELCLSEFLNKFQDNLNIDVVKVENIKKEKLDFDSNEERNFSTILVKTEENSFNVEQDLEIESKIEIVKEELKTDENEPTSVTSNCEEEDKKGAFCVYIEEGAHQDINQPIFNCKSCPQTFANETDLKNHKKNANHKKPHNKNEKLFDCKECGKFFTRIDNLRAHARLHEGERRSFICEQCASSFSRLSHLKRHKRVHTGEKPYICNQCGNGFGAKEDLKRHERIHTGERPYYCKQCGKFFSQSHSLKAHEKLHKIEKPYICDQCGKSFNEANHLKKHKRIHNIEKLYICDRCGQSFSDSCSLKRHSIIHTGEKPYSCEQCGNSFNRLSNLKRHERFHKDLKLELDSFE